MHARLKLRETRHRAIERDHLAIHDEALERLRADRVGDFGIGRRG